MFNVENIRVTTSVIELGVLINNKLSWSDRLDLKLVKCYRIFHYIKRNIHFCAPTRVKLTIYKTCLLSILLYNSQVWYPSTLYLRKIERLHKRAMYWITGKSNYSESLSYLRELPLCYRLIFADLLLFYKLLNGLLDFNIWDYVTYANNYGLRSSSLNLFVRNKVRKFKTNELLFYRVVHAGNHLIKIMDWTFSLISVILSEISS